MGGLRSHQIKYRNPALLAHKKMIKEKNAKKRSKRSSSSSLASTAPSTQNDLLTSSLAALDVRDVPRDVPKPVKGKKTRKTQRGVNLGALPDSGQEWDVHVKTLSGRNVSVVVHPYDSIQQLRSKVAIKEGIPQDQIILLLNGLQLDDGSSLREWNIRHGTVLFMTFRLRGG